MKGLFDKVIPLLYGKFFNFFVLFSPKKTAKKALDVFCTIRKGRVTDIQKGFLDPAKLALEQIGENQVQTYNWPGIGETVLLLHGWESNTFRWRNLIAKLRENNFNIIAFDAPGHGYSSGNRLHVPLYAISSRYIMNKYFPKYIVAHSLGSMTTFFDHYLEPNSSVEKIIGIGSPCEFSQFMDYYQNVLKLNDKVIAALNKELKVWLGFYFNEFSSAHFIENNTKKGLLFHDIEDQQVPYNASVKIQKHWKGSKLITTKGLGHSMHQEEVNNQIIAFLRA